MRKLLVLALLVVAIALPRWGWGQTCTLGPYISSTNLATINAAINGAADNAVACLQRGETWSASSGLNLTASHPNGSRVTICASTGTTCTDSGAADPILSITSNGTGLTVSGDGYELRHIAFVGSGGTSLGVNATSTSSHVRFVGGKLQNWCRYFFATYTGPTAPDDWEFGTLADLQEWTINPGTPACGQTGSFGALTNSAIRLNAHHIALGTNQGSHLLDFSSSGLNPYTAASSLNVVIEGGTYDYATITGGSVSIKLASGRNFVVRDNRFIGCADVIGFGSHGPSTTDCDGVDGADVYRNYFDLRGCTSGKAVLDDVATNLRVYNNVVAVAKGDFSTPFQVDCRAGTSACDQDITSAKFFNNTTYRTGNASLVGNGLAHISRGNNACNAGVTQPTGIEAANNLMIDTDAVDAQLWGIGGGACSAWGTNGAAVQSNFGYTPNDTTPGVTSCTADDNFIKGGATAGDDGAAGVSGDVGTAPELNGDGTGYSGDLVAAFTPLSSGSAVCGRADSSIWASVGIPATDFTGAARTANCIGALDVVGVSPDQPKDRGTIRGSGLSVTQLLEEKLNAPHITTSCLPGPGMLCASR